MRRPEPTPSRRRTAVCRRAVRIALLTAWHAIRFAARAACRRTPWRHALGVTLAELAERLGPTFLKIAQILSSRPDLLSPDITGPLARLQDQVAPVNPRAVPPLVEAAFGRRIDELFDDFDLEPVASASIAQVHRATLRDGRVAAVKIRRPGIETVVEDDFRLLRFLARCAAAVPLVRVMPVQELVEELAGPILMQLDFVQEAANNRALRRNLHGGEDVDIPALVDELCTGAVLTMDYVEGLQKVTADVLNEAERRRAALAGLRALYRMIFLDGLVHADLHPGNFFVREYGRIVILDTGLVVRLSDRDRRDFADFFFGIVNDEGDVCARIVYERALWRAPRCNRAEFERAMRELIGRHSSLRSRDFEVTRFVYELMDLQRRSGIRGSTSFIMTVLSMVVYDGICKQLHPECDFQAESRAYLITARYRRPARPGTARPARAAREPAAGRRVPAQPAIPLPQGTHGHV